MNQKMNEFPRRSKGAPTWGSCRVALLANSDTVICNETPYYIEEQRELEREAIIRWLATRIPKNPV